MEPNKNSLSPSLPFIFSAFGFWAVRPAACPGETRDAQTGQVFKTSHIYSMTTRQPPQHSTTRQHCLHTGQMGVREDWGPTAQSSVLKNKLPANVLCQHALCHTFDCPCPVSRLGREMLYTCSTLLVPCLTVLISSWMTRSIHLRQGVFSLTICFLTMASNARSGVNSPVLRIYKEDKGKATDRWHS